MKYYFIFEKIDGHPYENGWIEVDAKSFDDATEGFQVFHPNRYSSELLRCAGIWPEDRFRDTEMFRYGNRGHRAWERITVVRSRHQDEQIVDRFYDEIEYRRKFVSREESGDDTAVPGIPTD